MYSVIAILIKFDLDTFPIAFDRSSRSLSCFSVSLRFNCLYFVSLVIIIPLPIPM